MISVVQKRERKRKRWHSASFSEIKFFFTLRDLASLRFLDAGHNGRNSHICSKWRKTRRWRHVTTREKRIYLQSEGNAFSEFLFVPRFVPLVLDVRTNEQFLCKRTRWPRRFSTVKRPRRPGAAYAKHHELNFWFFTRAHFPSFLLFRSSQFPQQPSFFRCFILPRCHLNAWTRCHLRLGQARKSRFKCGSRDLKRDAKKKKINSKKYLLLCGSYSQNKLQA